MLRDNATKSIFTDAHAFNIFYVYLGRESEQNISKRGRRWKCIKIEAHKVYAFSISFKNKRIE